MKVGTIMICTMYNTESTPQHVLPAKILENLAARFRPAGVCLLAYGPDGEVAWHDQNAAPLFRQYVLPMLSESRSGAAAIIAPAQGAASDGPLSISHMIPGILLAQCPWTEKARLCGTLGLAAVSDEFRLGEDVVRLCSRLGIDGVWLQQQADKLPACDEPSLQRHGRMLLTMLRDQLRLATCEQELNGLSTQLASTYEELTLIYQISSGMKINRGPCEFFKQACQEVLEVMAVSGMGVALEASVACSSSPALYGTHNLPADALRRLDGQLMEMLPRRHNPLLINNLPADRDFAWLAEHASQLLAVPLQRQDQHLGCLFAIDKREGDFDSTDAKLLTSIANESAVFLENARLFEDVHGLMMGLLHSLTSAVDAKDAYTCGHSERVALLSRTLAISAGLTEHQVERIYMAGLLHDVGKIGVPEAVLQKAGKLTDEEFAEIKKHPAIGARILEDVKQVADLLPGVLHHHERYDGKGYPVGLSGENIPLMGRIICLADCFDAMTSSRTYRKAMPLEAALTEIRRCAGTQFDPQLAEVFLGIPLEQLQSLLHDHHRQCRPLMGLSVQNAA
jgi:HD-GYP domain-containing protein (c-di-GMP phosphodiesterase class II)